jgi:hypothetical protein
MGQPQVLEQLNTLAGWRYSRWCAKIPIISAAALDGRHDKRLKPTAIHRQGSAKLACLGIDVSRDPEQSAVGAHFF